MVWHPNHLPTEEGRATGLRAACHKGAWPLALSAHLPFPESQASLFRDVRGVTGVQGWAGRGYEQPAVVEGVPVGSR